jgi:hypothetical protein
MLFSDKVNVDFDKETSFFSQRVLRDENNREIFFNSRIDALNYMNKKGWDFVKAYVIITGIERSTH